jgi:hypothetical protein
MMYATNKFVIPRRGHKNLEKNFATEEVVRASERSERARLGPLGKIAPGPPEQPYPPLVTPYGQIGRTRDR